MEQKQIIALGFFDGVHMGHRQLLLACRQLADSLGCAAAALTFTCHPEQLVAGAAPGLINTTADRERLLRRFGMDRVILLPFDKAMMTMPWKGFFQLLLKKHNAAGLVCGHDFRFGNRGQGNGALLEQACREAGIPCIVVPEQKIGDITVSSTHIRSLIQEGQMETASQFLGHPHVFTGMVVPGKRLGRTLGIPTANLLLPDSLVAPRFGVYACRAWVEGKAYLAVTNVGTRPTVSGGYATVEPWILDFEGDLYGKEITLEFHKFLRPEQKFPSLAELQREIRRNGEQTREFFSKN